MHSKSVQHIRNDIKKLGNFYVNLIGKLDLSKTKKDIEAQSKGMNINVTPDVNSKGVQSATKQAMNNAQKVANTNKVKVGFELDRDKLVNQIKILGKENSKLFGSSDMTAKYNNLLDSAKLAQSKGELKSLRKQLSAFRAELKASNNDGLSWVNKLKESIKRYTSLFGGASFVYTISNQIRNAWQEAKILDDALVDLQKVTDEINSRDALYKYFDRSVDKAKELNVKVSSLIYSITEFKKMGWSLGDSEIGAEWATKLENVGDVDIDTAIASIKTSIASFDTIDGYGNDQLDKKLEAYVDLINNMSNKYSIDAQGLSEAIRLSAGTLTEAHTSIEEAVTMFATANKYYNNPDYLGNTVKIGSLRLRASSGDTSAMEELEEMGESVEELTSATSTLREKLLGLTGVDIMVDENTFKSYYNQLLEISGVIDKLDDTSRANVLETLFGKNRSAAGAAILSGMQESASAYADAITSAGSATKEYEVWMQSADAASQRFANNVTEAYQSIINGNTVRDLTNMGSSVLEFANAWGILEGSLRGVLLLGVGKFITTASMAFVQGTKSVERYGQALRMVNNIPNGNQRYDYLKQLASVTKTLTNEQLKQVLSNKSLSQQEKIRLLQLSGLSKKAATAKLAEMGLTKATQAQTVANNANILSVEGLKNAMMGLGVTIKTWFMSNPIGIALMGISLGASAISSAISNSNQKIEEQKARTSELTETWKADSDALNDTISEYQELQKKLSDTSLTTEEVKLIKEELATVQDSLITKYGEEASGIDLLNGKYDEQIAKLRELSAEKAKEYIAQNASVVEDDRKYLTETVAVSMKLGENDFEGLESYLSKNGLSKTFLAKDGFYIGGTGTREELYNQLVNLYSDVAEDFGSDTDNPAVKAFQLALSDVINNSFDKDEMEQAKSNVQAFAEAELLSNNTGRELYDKATNAVNTYNEALESGVGVEEAKNNLESVRNEVDNMTLDIYGAEDVFQSVFENISQEAIETANVISTSFVEKGFSKSKMISELNDTSEGFEELGKIYESIADSDPFDFKLLDNDNFKETFSGLGEVYTDFVEQVASTPNDINACQSAFDNLVTEWIKSLNILEGVTEENANLTVSMLEQMGVANAQQIVDQMFTIVNEESQIINDAEEEFLATYQNYLSSKDEADLAYLESSASKNGQLVSALGESYQQDYKNWCDLLSKKAEAYNRLVTAVGGSYNSAVSTVDNLMANGITPTMSSITAAEAAKGQYQMLTEAANKAKNSLKLDLSTIKTDFGSSYKPTSASGGSGSSSSKSKETTETFDWIKNKIEAVQRVISNLGKTVSATYKSWTKRNSALSEQISNINEEISVQQQAYAKYTSMANGVGLSTHYQDLVKNGAIDISTITDETLIEQIKSFEEFYGKAISCQDAIADLNDELADLARTQFDNLDKQFKNIEEEIQHEIDIVEGYIDQTEAKGYIENKSAYESLIKSTQKNVDLLTQKYSALVQQRDEAMSIGKADMYSDYWYELTADINSVESALQEANTALIEYNNSLRELEWERFDKGQEMISDLTAESEFLRDLMSDEKMFDEKGNATEFGDATFGLHAVDYNTYMSQATDYTKELLELNKQIAEDPSNQLLLDRRRELIETQREMILSANEEREAMKSLAEEGYNTMLDYMNELIDKRKSALDEMKSLSDYEKTISDQAQTVSELRKIQMALQNDSSESGQLALQQNAVKLKEAEETLRQSELDRQIEEEQKMLDNFANDVENWVSQRLDNLDGLVSDVIDSTNENSDSIRETLESVTNDVGISLTDEMQAIWSGTDGIKSVVSMYGDNFNTNVTTVNNTLLGIKSLLESMVDESDKDASDNITEVTSPSASTPSTPTPTPAPSTPSTTTNPSGTSSSSTGTIKVGGKINAGNAKIYDYAGDTSGESQYYKSDPYYIVLDERNNYLKVRHHSLKSGVTGWFKKSDVKAYKTGGLVDYTGLAWVDGQKKKPEAFLNAQDTENIGELKDILKEVDPLLTVEQIREFTSTMDGLKPIVESMVKRPNFVPNTSMNQNVTIHNEFTLHEVQNGEQVIDYLQRSKRFENIMYDIAFNKNSLAKYRW